MNYVQPYGSQPTSYPGQPQPQVGSQPIPLQQQPPQQTFSPQPQQLPPQALQQPEQQAPPQPQPQSQPQSQPQPQLQPQRQASLSHPQQSASSKQSLPVSQAQQGPARQQSEPPYVYDPSRIYADPNVQAWAQYYAQGGKDKAGAVYFISVPGVTDPAPPVSPQEPQSQSQPQQFLPEPNAQHEPSPVSRTNTSDSYLPYPGSPVQPNGTIGFTEGHNPSHV